MDNKQPLMSTSRIISRMYVTNRFKEYLLPLIGIEFWVWSAQKNLFCCKAFIELNRQILKIKLSINTVKIKSVQFSGQCPAPSDTATDACSSSRIALTTAAYARAACSKWTITVRGSTTASVSTTTSFSCYSSAMPSYTVYSSWPRVCLTSLSFGRYLSIFFSLCLIFY